MTCAAPTVVVCFCLADPMFWVAHTDTNTHRQTHKPTLLHTQTHKHNAYTQSHRDTHTQTYIHSHIQTERRFSTRKYES